MGNRKPKNYFAVAKGRETGIFPTWFVLTLDSGLEPFANACANREGRAECQAHTSGFHNADFKGFYSKEEAQEWLKARKLLAESSSTQTVLDASVLQPQAAAGERNTTAEVATSSSKKRKTPPRQDNRDGEDDPGPKSKKSRMNGGLESVTPRPVMLPETPAVGDSERETVYCDGSALGNGKSSATAGIGVYWGPGDSRYALHHRLFGQDM